MSETLRNHPTVMLKSLSVTVFVLAIMLLNPQIQRIETVAIILVVVACAMFLIYRWWSKTLYTFRDDEVLVERNTLFKNKKSIPYSKVASVNVVRDIFDRLFGTTTLSFNVNSGVNAARPEATLVLKIDDAERIRGFISSQMFDNTYKSEVADSHESVATFAPKDVIIHGIFSKPTVSIIFTILLLIYSVWAAFFMPYSNNSGSGLLMAIFLLVVGEVIPVVSMIIRYFNFKVYRENDTIYLQHGAIQTYRSSFDVHKINAVRVKRPLFAKLMHKSCLEAEVVGINAVANDVRPVLCLLIDDSKLEGVMKQLVPEFMYQCDLQKQPSTAKYPIIFKAAVATVIIALIAVYPSLFIFDRAEALLANEGIGGIWVYVVQFLIPILTAVIVAVIWTASIISFGSKGFNLGENMFTFVNGIIDEDTVTMQYDRVQVTEVSSGFVARRYGLGKCTISLLSSAGHTNIKSGYFDASELSEIGDTMLERLSNGKYDYSKCVI